MGLFLLWPQFRQPAAPCAANITDVLPQWRSCEGAAQWSHPCGLDTNFPSTFLSFFYLLIFLIPLCFCWAWGGLCSLWVRCKWVSETRCGPFTILAEFLISNWGHVCNWEEEHLTWGKQLQEKPTGTSLLLGNKNLKANKIKTTAVGPQNERGGE